MCNIHNGVGTATKTSVYLTFDVECAEARVLDGSLQPPLGYDLRVWGRFDNQRHELGIPLILRELTRSGLTATFFVEAFAARFFGEDGLREICRYLVERGQDVQLHVHPAMEQADAIMRQTDPPADDIAEYSVERQTELIEEGRRLLGRCEVPFDSIRAFRAGNFGSDNKTWTALAQAGLRLSSSVDHMQINSAARIVWPRVENALFNTGEGVWELPVSNFLESDGRHRHLQITAVSFSEMRHYLLEARRLGIREVTILGHPFEFFHLTSAERKLGGPNQITVNRLQNLCGFLRDHPQDFQVETVGALADRLGPPIEEPSPAPVLNGSRLLRYGRLVEQAYQRLELSILSHVCSWMAFFSDLGIA